MISAANVGFINQVIKEIPKDWGTGMLKKVRDVTTEEIREVMREVLLPLFVPGSADLVITCASIMEEVSLSWRQSLGMVDVCANNVNAGIEGEL